MFISRITAYREGAYGGSPDPTKPFVLNIEVYGTFGKTELKVSPDLSRRIVEIIGDEVVNAAKDIAQNMSIEALAGESAPALTTG